MTICDPGEAPHPIPSERLDDCKLQRTMRLRHAAVLVAVAASSPACARFAEQEQRGERAAAEKAERKTARVARELERHELSWKRAMQEIREATEAAEHQHEEYVQAVTRERAQYRRLLAKELRWIDQKVAELEHDAARAEGDARVEKQRDVASARGWRALLEGDLREIDVTSEEDWPGTKDRIERDLDEARPPSIPRSYEKSYGI